MDFISLPDPSLGEMARTKRICQNLKCDIERKSLNMINIYVWSLIYFLFNFCFKMKKKLKVASEMIRSKTLVVSFRHMKGKLLETKAESSLCLG